MEKARQEGTDALTTRDPGGIDVIVDVVPPEVVEQGEWSWELGGFSGDAAGQVQVWRNPQARKADLSQWFDVISRLEVPGYGTFTMESVRKATAEKRLTEIWLQQKGRHPIQGLQC